MTDSGILIVGSLNADLVVRTDRFPGPGETVRGSELATLPGGKGANQAAAAALLGGDVRMLGAVGADAHGELLTGSLRRAGADVDGVRLIDGVATGTAMITVNADGENTIVVSPGANDRLTADDVRGSDEFSGCAVLGLCLEIDTSVVLAASQRAGADGATVLLNLSPYAEVPEELLAATDVLLVNEHEASTLLGVDVESVDAAEVASRLAGRGIRRAVVTRGSEGALVFDDGESATVPAVPVTAVDTTGCGDAFMGALALRLAAGDALVQAAAFAAAVGAYAATGHGAQSSYPTLAALEAFRATR
ncbi:carbohydrate kinase [Leifsonia sp. Root227]|uniref:ribokinase n=1 Tax=Leifsonia sp. Root227 TaxID=1736496 RepID=UPI0006FC92BF|nr:ribokinase [Leifsonia sp. Root227]KRC49509.1 carbohydrate kinase [Leifsonia sp. Root227]